MGFCVYRQEFTDEQIANCISKLFFGSYSEYDAISVDDKVKIHQCIEVMEKDEFLRICEMAYDL